MIAKVASVIGEKEINIGSMNVVQKNDKHEESIMVINIDSIVDESILNFISQIDGVHDPKYVSLTV